MSEIVYASHPIAPCVDLRATFGRTFRFADDPSLAAERPDRRCLERAWLTRIPCAHGGFIAPMGGRRLQAFATSRRHRLCALSCVTVHQASADGAIVTFDVADLETVAAVLGAKRRRRLSDDQRARFKTAGAKTRFSGPETTITPGTEQYVA
jgi:hypothetical protein